LVDNVRAYSENKKKFFFQRKISFYEIQGIVKDIICKKKFIY